MSDAEVVDRGGLPPPDEPARPRAVRPPGPPPEMPPRFSAVEMLYHQHRGEAPRSLLDDEGVRYDVVLSSDEQPYLRRKLATEKLEPLDLGWLRNNVGVLLLRNDEGSWSVNPTDEERAEMAARVIELCVVDVRQVGEFRILVPPTESCRFRPEDAGTIHVRCAHGTARYTLCLVPR